MLSETLEKLAEQLHRQLDYKLIGVAAGNLKSIEIVGEVARQVQRDDAQ